MSGVESPLQARPRELPGALVAVCGILVLVGIGCFLAGLATDAPTAWRAFHVNWLFTMGAVAGRRSRSRARS